MRSAVRLEQQLSQSNIRPHVRVGEAVRNWWLRLRKALLQGCEAFLPGVLYGFAAVRNFLLGCERLRLYLIDAPEQCGKEVSDSLWCLGLSVV